MRGVMKQHKQNDVKKGAKKRYEARRPAMSSAVDAIRY